MPAKHELMHRAVSSNPYSTTYFAWLDIGLFRAENATTHAPFTIHLPPNFNQSRVGVSVLSTQCTKRTDRDIFLGNIVWICGAFHIARYDVMLAWSEQYMKFVTYFLSQGLMNLDQQVSYAAVSNHDPRTQIQPYHDDKSGYNPWFYLGYLCKE